MLGAVVVACTVRAVRVLAKYVRFGEIVSPDLVTLMSPAHSSVLVGASGLYGERRSTIGATYGHPPCGTHTSNERDIVMRAQPDRVVHAHVKRISQAGGGTPESARHSTCGHFSSE